MALAMVFAIQRWPTEKRIDVAKPTLSEEIVAAAQTSVVEKRADRIISLTATEPKPIATERVRPDAPASVPPVITVEETPKPSETRRRRHSTASREGSDICSRHGMRKVETRGGKSWRCRR